MGGEGYSAEWSVGGEEVTINLRCSNGSKFSVRTSLQATVEAFKAVVSQNCDVPADQQRLIYKGRILKDDQTLASYDLQADHTVHMVRGFASAASRPAAANPNPAPGVGLGAVANESGGTGGAGLGASLFPGLGSNSLGGSGASDLFGAGFPEFEQVQQQLTQNPNMMRELMNNPAIQSVMHNPDVMRNMIMSNPQMREIIDRNPELAHVLNDPGILRQAIEAARNPELMREMMRNTDIPSGSIVGASGHVRQSVASGQAQQEAEENRDERPSEVAEENNGQQLIMDPAAGPPLLTWGREPDVDSMEDGGVDLSVPNDSLAVVSHLLADQTVAEQEALSSAWMDTNEVVLPPAPSHGKGKSAMLLQSGEMRRLCSTEGSEDNSGECSGEKNGEEDGEESREGTESNRGNEDGHDGGDEEQSPLVAGGDEEQSPLVADQPWEDGCDGGGESVERGRGGEDLVRLAAGVAGEGDQGARPNDSQGSLHMEPAANMRDTGSGIGKDGEYTVTHLPCGSVQLSGEGGQDVVLSLDLFDGVGEGKRSRLLGILRTRPTTFLNLGTMAVVSQRLVLRSLCSFLKVLEMITPESASGEDFRALQRGLEKLKADGLQVGWLEEHIVRMSARITLCRLRSELGEVRSAIRKQRAAIREQQAALALMEEKELRITGRIKELEVMVPEPLDLTGKGLGV